MRVNNIPVYPLSFNARPVKNEKLMKLKPKLKLFLKWKDMN